MQQLQLFNSKAPSLTRTAGRWEKWYVGKWVDAMVAALTNPIMCGRTGSGISTNRSEDIVLERLIRLFEIGERHCEQLDAAEENGDSVEETYRKLGHEWAAAQDLLTNWEVCLLMMEVSLATPIRREGFEEYKRAFAHCFGIDVYIGIFGDSPLDIFQCEQARWNLSSRAKFPPLDEVERQWMTDFNAALKEPTLARELFGPEVHIGGS